MNKKKLIVVIILFILIVCLIFTIVHKKRNKKSNDDINVYDTNELLENAETIIEDENGGKIIETSKTLPESDMKKTDDNEKAKYEFKDVEVSKNNAVTLVKGKIKNKSGKKHKIQINVKFYRDDNTVLASNYTILDNIKSNEEKDFEIEIVGDFADKKYDIEVEYTD